MFVLTIVFFANAPQSGTNQAAKDKRISPTKEQIASENAENDTKSDKIKEKTSENQQTKETEKKGNNKQTGTKDEGKTSKTIVVAPAPGKTSTNKSTPAPTKPAQSSNQVPATLVETIDGDTIKVNYNGRVETIRYLLVDTPEEKKPNTCVQLFAQEAYNRNKQLVNSGKLTMEFEEHNKTDRYGRLLAYVFVNGASVQESLLKEGYARVAYIYYPPYKYLDEYRQAENIAKSKKLNIWSRPGFASAAGFNGCVSAPAKKPAPVPTKPKTTTPPAAAPNTPPSNGTEIFANCTELRKKYPDGVPAGHPAYQSKMDRDKDNYACEQ
ncbi:endonuclease [Bacillus sp. C11]|nr:endonuclease [Neobacillus terrae]